MTEAAILGCGAYLPERIVTNVDLEKIVDTNDEWITSRTGIKQRHIARDDELSSDMAAKAAKIAISSAGIDANDIGLIVVATTTADKIFPSTAVHVQEKLSITNGCGAFDVQAVCAGFIYAVSIAESFIKSGQADNVLVIGVDKMSSIVDWQDRGTCVLFGDGAGAVVIGKSKDEESRILSSSLYSAGEFKDILYTDGGVGSKSHGVVKMVGQEVFKHATSKMSKAIKDILKKNGLSVEDINYLIPHQANRRIMDMVAKKLKISESNVISTVHNHANTSAASIPLALFDGVSAGKIKKGDVIAFTAIGGGLTWGAVLLKW
ncbi:ketoacyl-ACP synthase III [Rickettsiales bacterium]|nr:ketoacyl-ACP synthase III [Rickettsiales bacterium]